MKTTKLEKMEKQLLKLEEEYEKTKESLKYEKEDRDCFYYGLGARKEKEELDFLAEYDTSIAQKREALRKIGNKIDNLNKKIEDFGKSDAQLQKEKEIAKAKKQLDNLMSKFYKIDGELENLTKTMVDSEKAIKKAKEENREPIYLHLQNLDFAKKWLPELERKFWNLASKITSIKPMKNLITRSGYVMYCQWKSPEIYKKVKKKIEDLDNKKKGNENG